jgi:hypothetical protein
MVNRNRAIKPRIVSVHHRLRGRRKGFSHGLSA